MRGLFTFLFCLMLTAVSTHGRAACTPTAGSLSGPVVVCQGSSITLSSTVSGGSWTSSDASVATVGAAGDVVGINGGTAIITYTVVDTCGTATASQMVTVNPTTAGVISGPSMVCVGNAIILTSTVPGGIWKSSNVSMATVSGGVVVGWTPGTVVITDSIANSCGTFTSSATVSVVGPTAGVIMGPGAVCQGSSITLTSTVPGGTWTSQLPSTASVGSSSGIVTGHLGGGTVISYTANNSCGLATVTTNILVDPLPAAGSLLGATSVCAGSTTTLLPTVGGGTWLSSNPAVATAIGGVVLGITAGTTNITYTVINSCGPASVTTNFTVNTAAIAGPVSGPSGICRGSNITLTGVTAGGTWSSSSPWIATVNPTTGVVHGVAFGTAVIFYAVNNSCGSSTAIKTVSVDTPVIVGSITVMAPGSLPMCSGTTITFSNAVAGGTWYLGTTSAATLATPPGGNAVVTAMSPTTGGTPAPPVLYYSFINGCGGSVVSLPVPIQGMPDVGTVSPDTIMCAGNNITMYSTGSGGTWLSSNTAVATVNSVTGVVAGLAPGTVNIMYVGNNTCGQDTASANVTVSPAPVVGVISGIDDSVCLNHTITFTPGAPGGNWSINGASAWIDNDGVVTGVSEGVFGVTYTVTNGCGSNSAVLSNIVVYNCTLGTPVFAGDASVSVYPNPAQNNLMVTCDAGIRSVDVTDILGQKVWQNANVGGKNKVEVDMSALAPGIYMVRVNNDHVYRVVKE